MFYLRAFAMSWAVEALGLGVLRAIRPLPAGVRFGRALGVLTLAFLVGHPLAVGIRHFLPSPLYYSIWDFSVEVIVAAVKIAAFRTLLRWTWVQSLSIAIVLTVLSAIAVPF